MDFILKYDEHEYLILLDEFTNENKTEVIRIPYSDKENDYVDYKIQVFIRNNEELVKLKVIELPERLKKLIGESVQDELSRIFVANPYFDEVLVFYGNEVFTYQDQYKPIACSECSKMNLYQKRSKGNKTDYIDKIKKLMEGNKNEDWPFQENLQLQFSVSDSQSRLDGIDLDNLAKTVFDIFKDVVYQNDNQIVSFAGSKDFAMNL